MARIRSIKPELWAHEDLSQTSISAQLIFIGLISFADDDGRLRANQRLLKSQIAPLRDDLTVEDIEQCLEELDRAGLIQRYRVEGRDYVSLPGFTTHQKINRPTPSRIPGPDLPNAEKVASPEEAVRPHGVLTDDSSREGKGSRRGSRIKEGRGESAPPDPDALSSKNLNQEVESGELALIEPAKSVRAPKSAAAATPESVVDAYNEICVPAGMPKCIKLTKVRIGNIKARQEPLTWWRVVFERAATTPFCLGNNDRGWRADFDFLTKSDENTTKLLEGKYDPSAHQQSSKPGVARRLAKRALDAGPVLRPAGNRGPPHTLDRPSGRKP